MSAVFIFLIETKMGRAIAIGSAIAIGCLIGWGIFANHYYVKGWNAAIAAIAAKNEAASHAVEKATKDVEDCLRSGRAWDTVDGMCRQ